MGDFKGGRLVVGATFNEDYIMVTDGVSPQYAGFMAKEPMSFSSFWDSERWVMIPLGGPSHFRYRDSPFELVTTRIQQINDVWHGN